MMFDCFSAEMSSKIGIRERLARNFLEAAKVGDLDLIKCDLHNCRVNVDVADLNGNSALFLAAVSNSSCCV